MYIRRLDGLRGFAVIMVMWAHFLPIKDSAVSSFLVSLGDVVGVGYFGVDLFFVLSGFLITRIMFSERRASVFSVRRFFIKRVLRIFPIYYLTITVLFIFGYIPVWEYGANFFYVSNYFYTFNVEPSPLRHTWSLSVEEQFYLMWPFLFLFLGSLNFARLVFYALPFIAIISSIIALYWLGDEGPRFLYRSISSRMLSLSLGAALAIMEVRGLLVGHGRYRLLAAILPVVFLVSAYALSGKWVAGSALLKMLGFSLLSFVLVWTVVAGDFLATIQEKVLSSRVMVYIGTISYGLYLYHAVILYLLNISEYQAEEASASAWLMALLATFVVSALSYEFFERKVQSLRQLLLKS